MTFLRQILAGATGLPIDKIEALIVAGGKADPALKPFADALLAKLDAPLDPKNVLEVNDAAAVELRRLFTSGKMDGRERPSDII